MQQYRKNSKWVVKTRPEKGRWSKPSTQVTTVKSTVVKPSYGPKRVDKYDLHSYKINQYTENGIQDTLNIATNTNETHSIFGAFQFRLSQIVNFLKWTALYDQYKFRGCAITLMPVNTDPYESRNATATTTVFVPIFYSHVDYDDVNTPTTVQQVTCNPHAKKQPLKGQAYQYIKPKMSLTLTDTGTATTFNEVQEPKWIDCNSPAVDHLGLKWVLQVQTSSVGTFPGDVEIMIPVMLTYYIDFRHVRNA